jgi:hypothetical protein
MTIDSPAANARPGDASTPPLTLAHMPIEDMEVRLEAVRFLAIFTAAWLIFVFVAAGMATFAALTNPARPLALLFSAYLSPIAIVATVLFACLWVLSTARTGAAFAAAIFLAGFVVVKNLWVISNDIAHGRLRTGWSLPMALVGCLYIAYQVVRVGWIAWQTPASEQAAIAAVPKERASMAAIWLQVLGVPPIWFWLGSRRQKAGALLLFGLSMVVFSLVVFLVMGELTSFPLTAEVSTTEPQQCLQYSGANECDPYYRWGLVMATILFLAGSFAAGFCVVGGLRYAARRFTRLSLERLLSKDQRPAILFLRSFRDDQVKLSRPRRRLFFRIVAFGEPRPTLDHILLEEATPCGPVVAIGAPGSRPPFGAARKYVTKDQWQEVVRELARKAGAIVVALDETEGVCWEVKTLFAAEHFGKTLFLLPPRLTAPAEVQRVLSLVFAATPAMKIVADTISGYARRACIGWYVGGDGVLYLMTTTRPSHLSYVLGVRIFLQARAHAP